MIIDNLSKKLVIKLTTNITTALRLEYKRNGVVQDYMEVTPSDGVAEWTIPFASLSLNDTLTDFRIYKNGQINLASLNEGITWLVDGVIEHTDRSNSWETKFQDNKEHTIQAVYMGNERISMASTPSQLFYVNQSSSSTPPDGYKLEWIDNSGETFTYQDGAEFICKLTQGGNPVANQTIEISMETGVDTNNTRTDGTVHFKNNSFNVGTYTFRAKYFIEDEMKAICDRKVIIKKGEVDINVPSDVYQKGESMCLNFKNPNGEYLQGEKISMYINGKLYNDTTNVNGNIWIKFAHTGYYKFNIVFQGNNNLNSKSVTFAKNITQ